MRAFAQRRKVPPQTASAESAIPRRAPLRHSHEVNALHSYRPIGSDVAPRLPEADRRNAAAGTTTNAAGVGFDFSLIPVHASALGVLQTKPGLGTPGDIYEREADRVAEQVMRMPEPQRPSVGGQHADGRNSHEHVQTRRVNAHHAGGVAGSPVVHEALRPTGQPLDSATRRFMEPRFGLDFSHVRIHADSKCAQMADALNARAFTVGSDIYLGRGELQPRNVESDRLLAHELAHVTQQSRMGPALQPKLKITGKPADVARAMTLLNSGLQVYTVSADKSGAVSIKQPLAGPPTPQQQALADRLTTVINDPKDVLMTVSAGSKTIVGSYATGDFDISDVESIGVSALIHEIVEQYQKQVKGAAFGSLTTGAHGEATKAEEEVKGAKRGADKVISSTQNADGTIDGVIETPYTYPDGTVKTMVATLKNNNIVSVTWK